MTSASFNASRRSCLLQIGTQLDYHVQGRTNSRLREMHRDITDAMTNAQQAITTTSNEPERSNSNSQFQDVSRPWSTPRKYPDNGKGNKPDRLDEPNNRRDEELAMKRWQAEKQRDQAWNNVGQITGVQQLHPTNLQSKKDTERQDKRWSIRTQGGSTQASRHG